MSLVLLFFSASAHSDRIFHEVSIHHHSFNLELCRTDSERSKGLMYRTTLAPQSGMLFFFAENEKAVMWMKNTYIPLDMLFIAPNGSIACIITKATPRSLKHLSCNTAIMAVIEINAGEVAKFGIKTGDKILRLPQYIIAFNP